MAKSKKPSPSIVSEPQAAYTRVKPTQAGRLRHGAKPGGSQGFLVFKRLSAAELLREVTKPMPKSRVRERLEEGWLDRAFLSKALNISTAQLADRLAGAGVLIPAEAERVVLSEQLVAHGVAAFGDRAVFTAWLKDESPALRGQRPIDLIRTTTGMALVMDELIGIEHGIPV